MGSGICYIIQKLKFQRHFYSTPASTTLPGHQTFSWISQSMIHFLVFTWRPWALAWPDRSPSPSPMFHSWRAGHCARKQSDLKGHRTRGTAPLPHLLSSQIREFFTNQFWSWTKRNKPNDKQKEQVMLSETISKLSWLLEIYSQPLGFYLFSSFSLAGFFF